MIIREDDTMPEQYLEVGKITSTHGIMGEVRVQPWADSPEFLCKFDTLYVDKSHWPIKVERARVHKNMVILKLEGVTDVPSALSLKNAILYIDRNDANLPEGSFFLADLIGLEVREAASGNVLGQIADVLDLPANNVYVVRGGKREILIPAVDEFIAETNIDGGYVLVNLIEGL
jgi:16S rRNA processing protein RimM